MAKVEFATVSDTLEFDLDSANHTKTVTVPTGTKIVSGGFKVENLTNPQYSQAMVGADRPTDAGDGWTVTVHPNGLTGDDIRLTVYATHT